MLNLTLWQTSQCVLRRFPTSLCTSDTGKDASVSFPAQDHDHRGIMSTWWCLYVWCAKMRRCGFSTCYQQLPPQQLLDHSCSKQLLLVPNHQSPTKLPRVRTMHQPPICPPNTSSRTMRPVDRMARFFSAVCAMVISSVCYSHTGHHDFLTKIVRVKSWRKQLGKAVNFNKNCRYPSCLSKKLARNFSLWYIYIYIYDNICILKALGNLHASFPNTPTLSQQDKPLWNGCKKSTAMGFGKDNQPPLCWPQKIIDHWPTFWSSSKCLGLCSLITKRHAEWAICFFRKSLLCWPFCW